MGVPSPALPSFVDGTIVHQADLNALATNLMNLYTYNQGGFLTQRPCVIAVQTTGQSIPNTTDTLVQFQSAPVNTANMWVASQSTQITIQTAGVYLLIGAVHYPSLAGATTATDATANIWVNGTSSANAVMGANQPAPVNGSGPVPNAVTLQNLAAGSVVYLDAWHSYGASTTLVAPYGSFLAAIYLTPST